MTAKHVFEEHALFPRKCLELVEPGFNGYSNLSKVECDEPKTKVSLYLLDLMAKEMKTIQKAVPEVHNVLVQKANEYVMQIQPNLQEGVKGTVGSFFLTKSCIIKSTASRG